MTRIRKFFALAFVVLHYPLPAASELSEPAESFKELFDIFQTFKTSTEFGDYCYSANSVFSTWADAIRILEEAHGRELFLELSVLPGDLWQLGWMYCQNDSDIAYRNDLEARLEFALSGEAPEAGEGVVLTTDVGCADLAVFQRIMAALVEGDYSLDYYDFECQRVYSGTIVDGPIDEASLSIADGWEPSFVQVRVPNGDLVWISDGVAEFTD